MKIRKFDFKPCEPDLTLLVNVVFLSLMLFMIGLHFQHVKAGERAKLPYDRLARPPAVEPERELILNFGYRRSSTGRRRAPVPTVLLENRHAEVGELSPELDRQRRALQSRTGNENLADVTVVIRADADVPSGLVQELVQRCREVGFANFSLQTLPTEP